MKKLNQKKELELISQGYKFIAGIDEAGRGSWAGPVVAACLVYNPQVRIIPGVNDSKKILSDRRTELYKWLIGNFDFGIGIISHQTIDEVGILNATRLAMAEAISNLRYPAEYLLIDAVKLKQNIPQENIIHGDEKVWSIAAASIIAKVTRDNLMIDSALEFSGYGFERHKGYGTADHASAIERLGICEIHRKSYKPIRRYLI